MRRTSTATLLLCLAGAACAPPAPIGEPMTGEAFIALARGNTMDGRGADGSTFRTYVAPDLAQRGAARPAGGGSETRYQGTIRPSANGFCSRSPQLRGGEERCFEVRREGETLRTYWNGTLWTTMTVRPGNPFEL